MQFKNLYIFCFSTFLFSSCSSNNYVLTSINNPFIDSSKVLNVKMIASLDTWQAQSVIRLNNNFVFMADYFTNLGWVDDKRTAANGGLGYNFYPNKYDKTVEVNFSTGMGTGLTNYDKYNNYLDNTTSSCSTNYINVFLQAGLNKKASRKIHFLFFYKANFAYYDYYYFSREDNQEDRRANTNKELFKENVFFKGKSAIIHQLSCTFLWKVTSFWNIMAEVGAGIPQPLFNPNDYKTYYSSKSGIIDNKNRGTFHPNYFPVYFRIGSQFNIPNLSSVSKTKISTKGAIQYRP